jgi:hypothetical protein
MLDLCFWLYLANSVVLICHEIDSAYWKEWRLFGHFFGSGSDERCLGLFLALHVPMLLTVQWGLVETWRHSFAGLVLSLVLGGAGIFAFSIHAYFLKTGRPEFRVPMSMALLTTTLIVSLGQIAAAAWVLAGGPKA